MPEENSSKGIVGSVRPVTLLQLTGIAEATRMAYGNDYRFHARNTSRFLFPGQTFHLPFDAKQLRRSRLVRDTRLFFLSYGSLGRLLNSRIFGAKANIIVKITFARYIKTQTRASSIRAFRGKNGR